MYIEFNKILHQIAGKLPLPLTQSSTRRDLMTPKMKVSSVKVFLFTARFSLIQQAEYYYFIIFRISLIYSYFVFFVFTLRGQAVLYICCYWPEKKYSGSTCKASY